MIDKTTHRHILYHLIKEIFAQPEAKYVAFKWWTMAYFLHWLQRFSTDIDLDLLYDSIDMYSIISRVASKYGDVKLKKHLILSYKKWYDHIKVDLNRKIRKANKYQIVNFYGTSIQVQDQWTMVTNKLVTFIERKAQRDLYDTRYFLKNNFPINESLLTERTALSPHAFRSLLHDKVCELQTSYKPLDGLGELLDEEQKAFVKKHLMTDLINLIQFRKDFE